MNADTSELLGIVEAAIAVEASNGGRAAVALSLADGAALAHLRLCLVGARGSDSDFNQGVVRGLEIAVAQIELRHHHNSVVEKACAPNSRDGAIQ